MLEEAIWFVSFSTLSAFSCMGISASFLSALQESHGDGLW